MWGPEAPGHPSSQVDKCKEYDDASRALLSPAARAGNASTALSVPGSRGLSGDSLGNRVLYYHVYKLHCVRRLSSGADTGPPGVSSGVQSVAIEVCEAVMESRRSDKEGESRARRARQTPRPASTKGLLGLIGSPGRHPLYKRSFHTKLGPKLIFAVESWR